MPHVLLHQSQSFVNTKVFRGFTSDFGGLTLLPLISKVLRASTFSKSPRGALLGPDHPQMERGSSVVWGDIGSPEHRSLTKLIGSPGERKPPRDSPGESPERTGSRPRCSTTTQTKWRWHRFYKSSTCSNPLLSCWSSETNERELLQRKLPSLITINTKRLKAFPWWVLFFSVFYICEVRVFTCS